MTGQVTTRHEQVVDLLGFVLTDYYYYRARAAHGRSWRGRATTWLVAASVLGATTVALSLFWEFGLAQWHLGYHGVAAAGALIGWLRWRVKSIAEWDALAAHFQSLSERVEMLGWKTKGGGELCEEDLGLYRALEHEMACYEKSGDDELDLPTIEAAASSAKRFIASHALRCT